MTEDQDENDLRSRALKRLRQKREFIAHLIAYVSVNTLLIVIWAAVTGGFFWPVFPLLGWGIGIAFHAWDVYQGEPSESDIAREMEHLRRRST